MKNLLLIILILAFAGCKKDGSPFDVTIPAGNISFRAIAGGAVMYYKLPAEKEISAINVRYEDVFGEELLCSGSYACDSLVLLGFNEAQHGVRALVTLCDRNYRESAPVEVFFDTEDSGPVAFFDNVEVLSGWEGFIVTYTAPEDARGLAHIFYVGEDPLSGEPDTILVKSFPIRAGTETISIIQQQKRPSNDVIIRTEDFRGYIVMQRVWHDVETLESVLLDNTLFDFEDSENMSVEDDYWCLGYKYLFDGNTKGSFFARENELQLYTAGPHCTDRTLFIIDFHIPKTIAAIRFYAILNNDRALPYGSQFPYYSIFRYFIFMFDMLPCNLTVYASNDKDNWVEIGSYVDNPITSEKSRWCYRTRGGGSYFIDNIEDFEAADPCYLEVSVPPRESFRYLKVVFHKLYLQADGSNYNIDNYTCLQELEIYAAKD